jgi:hypothetical protein
MKSIHLCSKVKHVSLIYTSYMKNIWWDSQFGFESWSSCHNLLGYDTNIIPELIIESEYCQLNLASSTYIIMGRNPCFALCCKSYTVSNLIIWQDEMKFVTILPNMIFLTLSIKSYTWHFYFTGLILLFVIAWPISFLFSFLWIFLQPFEGCFPILSDCNGFLEKFVTCKLQILSKCFNICLWILTFYHSFLSFSKLYRAKRRWERNRKLPVQLPPACLRKVSRKRQLRWNV